MPFADRTSPDRQGPKLTLFLAIAALLFITLPTVNLVNINISRILERASEIGVRKAFGAPSRTLVAQFVVENVILTLIGGAIGLVLSALVLRGLNRSGFIAHSAFTINVRVFACAVVLAIVFGLRLRRVSGVAHVAAPPGRGAQGRTFAMIRHLLRLIWNRKRQNLLLTVEIFFSFLVVFVVLLVALNFAVNAGSRSATRSIACGRSTSGDRPRHATTTKRRPPRRPERASATRSCGCSPRSASCRRSRSRRWRSPRPTSIRAGGAAWI